MPKRLVSAIVSALIMVCYGVAWADDPPMVTKEQLSSMLGKADLIVLDVRTPYDWKKSDAKIKGAVREDPMQSGTWIGKYSKEKTIVLYCA